jgi:hypothetical protein
LGDTLSNKKIVPTQVGTATNWKAVKANESYNVALKQNGTLWTWGRNTTGVLGNGTTNDRHIPQQVGSINDWKTIEAGWRHILAIRADGSLWGWGLNDFRQVGVGNVTSAYYVLTPTPIGSDTGWVEVAASRHYSFGIKMDGTLWGWGSKDGLGIGNQLYSVDTPIQINGDTNWRRIHTQYSHTIALKKDGTLWSWGANIYGCLGLDTLGLSFGNVYYPMQVGNDTTWKNAHAGRWYTAGLSSGNVLKTWGWNENGFLGDGGFANRYLPLSIPCGGVLPVQLISFRAYLKNNQPVVDWRTENESGISAFQVQRSFDGLNFETVSTIAAGNISRFHYLFTDTVVLRRKLFYRLRIVQKDGQYSYSPVSILTVPLTEYLHIYPNPAIDWVIIEGTGIQEIIVTDYSGRTVLKAPITGKTMVNISRLAPGIYMANGYSAAGKQIISKLIKK